MKAIVLSFLSQFFQTVIRLKMKYISKRQRYMAKVRWSVLKLHSDTANV